MPRILFLAHRIPYPPNKGDKIRSWNFLQRLIEEPGNTVHLGFFVDDLADLDHVPFLETRTASLCHQVMTPTQQKVRSLSAFFRGKSLTESAYPSKKLRRYVSDLIDGKFIDVVYLFSAATFTWLPKDMKGIPVITDLVDVDSAKWQAYAMRSPWPMSAIYGREAAKLLTFEQEVSLKSTQTYFVSDDEAKLFRQLSGQERQQTNISGLVNGVDTEKFDPSRYGTLEKNDDAAARLIFCGAMDYQPNIEAVCWFAAEVFPKLRFKIPNMELYIAGRPVAPQVERLNSQDGITVTGGVPDMADEVAKADIVIAPLLTARGIQNKVLEGMAMAKPVVATSMANEGINAPNGVAITIADDADTFVSEILKLSGDADLRSKIGLEARAFVQTRFSWDQSYAQLKNVIENNALRALEGQV